MWERSRTLKLERLKRKGETEPLSEFGQAERRLGPVYISVQPSDNAESFVPSRKDLRILKGVFEVNETSSFCSSMAVKVSKLQKRKKMYMRQSRMLAIFGEQNEGEESQNLKIPTN